MRDANSQPNNPRLGQREKEFIRQKKEAVFERWPLLFTLLGTFGLVATFYGFERMIDAIPLFANNPFILFVTGIIVLLFTGTLYQRLGK